jgi:hypothetical protein
MFRRYGINISLEVSFKRVWPVLWPMMELNAIKNSVAFSPQADYPDWATATVNEI